MNRDEITVPDDALNAMLTHIQALAQRARQSADEEQTCLEAVVGERTRETALRNTQLRILLDSVGQGLLGADLQGNVAAGRSASVARWFGTAQSDDTLSTYLAPKLSAKKDGAAARQVCMGCHRTQRTRYRDEPNQPGEG